MPARIITAICLAAALMAADQPALPRVRPPSWAQPVVGGGPENFYKVDDSVWRSAQPDRPQMQTLAAMGIRTVLNLREYHDDEDEAKGTGLVLVRVPLDAGRLDAAGLKRGLDAVRSAAKPALVHCWHGSDRTGAVVAAWRMVEGGWTREAAIDEFVHGGFGYHDDWFPELVTLLQTVDLDALRAKP